MSRKNKRRRRKIDSEELKIAALVLAIVREVIALARELTK